MRISSLTGLRGIAAVAVMLYHIPQPDIFRPYTIPFVSRAYLCVDLFFVLSGFVIALGYYDRVMTHLSGASYGDFLVNRIARVFPLHLVVALSFFGKQMLNFSHQNLVEYTPLDLVANLLMIQSWGLGTSAIAGNSWSVSTECVAYLVFPLIAVVIFSRALWPALIAAVAVLYLVSASGLGVEGPLDVVSRTSLLPVWRCLAGFAFGVSAYRLAQWDQVRRLLSGNIAFVASCALFLGAFAVPRGDLLVVCMAPLLVMTCYFNGSWAQAVMANRLSFHLGVISYSIYLWHPLFRDTAARIASMLHARGMPQYDIPIIVVMVLVTWLFCWISYEVIEVRGHKAIKAIQRRFRRAPAPALARK